MAKASSTQLSILKGLSAQVFEVMREMEYWENSHLQELESIRLGVLRKDSTQRHGVTRWKTGVDLTNAGPTDVDVIDLHPELLNAEWWPYARFVLYHEFLHALGNIAHDNSFKSLESMWPSQVDGKSFTELMRVTSSKWIWRCGSCGHGYPRRKRSKGRYRCRTCNCVLVDETNKVATMS